jgi:hypothetical protein
MGNGPIQREVAERERAAAAFLEANIISPAAMARLHAKPAPPTTVHELTRLRELTLYHLSGWSAGYLDQCRGLALTLHAYLHGVDKPERLPDDSALRTGVDGEQVQSFLLSRPAGTVDATRSKLRWLAGDGARLDVAAFSSGSAGVAKRARLDAAGAKAAKATTGGPTGRRTAPPEGLDEYAHLCLLVQDTDVPAIARGAAAQYLVKMHQAHRYITAQRLGNHEASRIHTTAAIQIDLKKKGAKAHNVPACGMRHTPFGFDLWPILTDSLRGVFEEGFLLRDFDDGESLGDPFAATMWLDTPISSARHMVCLRNLLSHRVRYPDGVLRAPMETPESLLRLKPHTSRHFLPSVGACTYEPPSVLSGLGPWDGSSAETTSVPTMGNLCDLIALDASRAASCDDGSSAPSYATVIGYAQHPTGTLLPDAVVRMHVALGTLFRQQGPDLTRLSGDAGWLLLRRVAHERLAQFAATSRDPALGPPATLAPQPLGPAADAQALGPTAALPAPVSRPPATSSDPPVGPATAVALRPTAATLPGPTAAAPPLGPAVEPGPTAGALLLAAPPTAAAARTALTIAVDSAIDAAIRAGSIPAPPPTSVTDALFGTSGAATVATVTTAQPPATPVVTPAVTHSRSSGSSLSSLSSAPGALSSTPDLSASEGWYDISASGTLTRE